MGINQCPPQPSPIEEGVKCVGCIPHPVLRTIFSHTGEKEEIYASPLHSSLKTRAAFTLSEVLITLGICECSPDKGAQNATYIGSAPGQTGEVIAGACCSAKYLME